MTAWQWLCDSAQSLEDWLMSLPDFVAIPIMFAMVSVPIFFAAFLIVAWQDSWMDRNHCQMTTDTRQHTYMMMVEKVMVPREVTEHLYLCDGRLWP